MSDQTGNLENQAPASNPAPSGASAASTSGAQLPALGDKWYESLPEDIRGEASLRTIQDINSLAKSYVHAQKAIGAEKVVIPSKHATPEDWRKVFNKLGLPEKMEEYGLEKPKDKQINEDFFNATKEKLFQLGIMPNQAKELVDWYMGQEEQMVSRKNEELNNNMTKWQGELKNEWGKAFDQKVAQARLALDHVKDPNLVKLLEETGLGSHPSVVKALQTFGSMLKEGTIVNAASSSAKSPSEAAKQLTSIYNNYEHPYWKVDHPGHKAAVEEVRMLSEYQYPENEQGA